MSVANVLHFDEAQPEWRRSGRFFLIALLLHGVILFYPLQLALGKIASPPPAILAKLVEPAAPLPIAPSPAPVHKATQAPKPPPPKHTPPPPRPVLALAAKPDSPPPALSLPIAPPALPTQAPTPATSLASVGPTVNTMPPATVTAAKYDAAYLNNPKPSYPPLSRRLGEEGKVLLKVRITREGLPSTVDLEKSSSFERLDNAARQAVSRWRFVPAKRGDEAIEASVVVPIVFRLDS